MTALRAALVAVAAVLAMAAPAHGLADDAAPRPVVETPLPTVHGRALVAFDAPRNAWGLRTFASEVDRLLPGVRIFTRGTCADHPRATCVRVFTGRWDDASQRHIAEGLDGWGAVAKFPAPRLREVWLNEQTPHAKRYAVAAHEFGHILGLNHHAMHGVCGGQPDETRLSWSEIRALRAAYPTK